MTGVGESRPMRAIRSDTPRSCDIPNTRDPLHPLLGRIRCEPLNTVIKYELEGIDLIETLPPCASCTDVRRTARVIGARHRVNLSTGSQIENNIFASTTCRDPAHRDG